MAFEVDGELFHECSNLIVSDMELKQRNKTNCIWKKIIAVIDATFSTFIRLVRDLHPFDLCDTGAALYHRPQMSC